MSKAIVFCADGTWNGPGEPDSDDTSTPASNVFKLFLKLAGTDLPGTMQLAKEQERNLAAADGSIEQAAKICMGSVTPTISWRRSWAERWARD